MTLVTISTLLKSCLGLQSIRSISGWDTNHNGTVGERACSWPGRWPVETLRPRIKGNPNTVRSNKWYFSPVLSKGIFEQLPSSQQKITLAQPQVSISLLHPSILPDIELGTIYHPKRGLKCLLYASYATGLFHSLSMEWFFIARSFLHSFFHYVSSRLKQAPHQFNFYFPTGRAPHPRYKEDWLTVSG